MQPVVYFVSPAYHKDRKRSLNAPASNRGSAQRVEWWCHIRNRYASENASGSDIFCCGEKNLKRDPLRFFNIHFVTNYQKNSRRPLATSKNSHKAEKGRFIESKKVEKCDTFALDSFLFHVRCFRCVQNEVISTYGKSA